jgi:hypothetical protein
MILRKYVLIHFHSENVLSTLDDVSRIVNIIRKALIKLGNSFVFLIQIVLEVY